MADRTRRNVTWFQGSPWAHLIAADILRYGPVSRTTLAGYHDLSQGTLSRIVKNLLYEGVVHATASPARSWHVPAFLARAAEESQKSGRGRPRENLEANGNAATFIGVNVRGECVRAGAVNVACALSGAKIHSAPLPSQSPQAVSRVILALVKKCRTDLQKRGLPQPTFIGICLGGHIKEDGRCGYAPFLHWDTPVDLAGMVKAGCGIPAFLFNNVSAYMRYLQWFGEGRGLENFAVLTIGIGVGYGLVSGGRVAQVPGSSYGLAGHILVDPDGPRCFQNRGHRGCSQCLTDESLALEYSRMTGKTKSFDDYARDAQNPRKAQAQNLRDREGYRLGVLIGTIADLAMVNRVFIGGESNWVLEGKGETINTGIDDFRPSHAPAVPFTFLEERSQNDLRWVLGAATEVIRRYVLGANSRIVD